MLNKKITILLAGKAGSGKDTVADLIMQNFGKEYDIKRTFFAKELKKGCTEDFKMFFEVLNGLFRKWHEKLKDFPDNEAKAELAMDLSYYLVTNGDFYKEKNPISRALMQIYGTEIMRGRVADNYWASKVDAEIAENPQTDIYLVTDFRFRNEILNLKKSNNRNIYAFNIIRPNQTEIKTNNHASEGIELKDFAFTEIIINDGSMNDLEAKVKTIMADLIKDNEDFG